MSQPKNSAKRKFIATFSVFFIVVAIVIAAAISAKKNTPKVVNMSSSNSSNSSSSSVSTQSVATADSYKNGSYSATGFYESPGGGEQITINVTLNNDIITATSAKSGAGDPTAQQYQEQFIAGYKQLVVGKDINKLNVSRVSGSSLTSQGFNDAINQIEEQAKQS